MNQKIIPIVSIVIGVIAFFLTTSYLQRRESAIERMRKEMLSKMRQVEVMAAVRDMPQGRSIQASDLMKKPMFEQQVRRDAVRYGSEAKMILGRKTLYRIKRGDVVGWDDIEGGSPEEKGLAPMVTPGLRAISITVGGAAAVSGHVRGNDRVDVLGTFSFPSKNNPEEMETVTLTVLQDVTILATGKIIAGQRLSDRRSNASNYSSVTLEVTPSEAELLVFAQQLRGRLTLALRNPDDNQYKPELDSVDFQYLQRELPRLNRERQTRIRRNTPLKSSGR